MFGSRPNMLQSWITPTQSIFQHLALSRSVFQDVNPGPGFLDLLEWLFPNVFYKIYLPVCDYILDFCDLTILCTHILSPIIATNKTFYSLYAPVHQLKWITQSNCRSIQGPHKKKSRKKLWNSFRLLFCPLIHPPLYRSNLSAENRSLYLLNFSYPLACYDWSKIFLIPVNIFLFYYSVFWLFYYYIMCYFL